MYSSVEEVRKGIKDEAVDVLIGGDHIESKTKREKILKDIISEAIEEADGEIDGYLNKQHPTPLASPVPKIICKFSKDIAMYNIFSRIGIDENARENVIYLRYKSAITFLESVAKGINELPLASSPQQSVHASDYRMNSSKRVFSRKSLGGW